MSPRPSARPSVLVIGGGFNGLTAAALLARRGHAVTLLDRHAATGGVARVWERDGHRFDMGPSWYLMPEVFERFFARFGKRPEDHYSLVRLKPGFRVFFGEGEKADVPAEMEGIEALFERFESGGAARLRGYLADAKYKYDVAMREFLYRDYPNIFSFFNARMMLEGPRLHVFDSVERHAARWFRSRQARQLLAYNMVFLGTAPAKSPALYSLMSHVDLTLGVYYPMGGIGAVVAGVERTAREAGVDIRLGVEAKTILVKNGKAAGVDTTAGVFEADLVVHAGDASHAETVLLAPEHRSYAPSFWDRRTLAPSCFLLYLGLDKKVTRLQHHSLFLDRQWNRHFRDIFDRPAWPENPSWYLSATSLTDPGTAPAGKESVFILVPTAPGLADDDATRDAYAEKILAQIEQETGESIRPHVRFRRIYSQRDFQADHFYQKGTALGHAHTLLQTAVFRVRRRHAKVKNLYFTGHAAHPGIGMPMALIGAEVLEAAVAKDHP